MARLPSNFVFPAPLLINATRICKFKLSKPDSYVLQQLELYPGILSCSLYGNPSLNMQQLTFTKWRLFPCQITLSHRSRVMACSVLRQRRAVEGVSCSRILFPLCVFLPIATTHSWRDNSVSQESFWSDDDIQTLRMVLDLTPDLSPCDLATICRKPCQQVSHVFLFFLFVSVIFNNLVTKVFEQRQYIIPDAIIAKRDKPLKTRPVRNSSSEFSGKNCVNTLCLSNHISTRFQFFALHAVWCHSFTLSYLSSWAIPTQKRIVPPWRTLWCSHKL